MPVPKEILYLTEEEVKKTLTVAEAVDLAEKGIKVDAVGQLEHIFTEWPDIVAERSPGRETSEEIIVFIALGIWGEYAAILPEAYRRAESLGLGQRLPCSHG